MEIKFFKKIYTVWCGIVFVGLFLLLFPLFFILIQKQSWHKYSSSINRVWAKIAMFLVGIRVEFEGIEQLDQSKTYVFCANHFSLLDIVSFGFSPVPIVYVGKESLAKIPLFGYMFRKLHITVKRSNPKSSFKALQDAIQSIEEGRSPVMFPEGGILTKHFPKMVRFKDGPFRAAIEKQIELVPVTLPDNWIILPDEKSPLITRKPMRMIFHDPIPTVGLNINDIDSLKKKVFTIIDNEIEKYWPAEVKAVETSILKAGVSNS